MKALHAPREGTSYDPFPVRFFALYFVFYAAQALYGTYMNLFLGSVGFSKTQIGLMVSLSTACLLITQPFWGILSDKARYKNTVVAVLMGMAGLFSLAFPRIQKPGVMTLFVCLMAISFFPIAPLKDNITLEYLNDKKWDFGQIRMGGTIGYALTVLVVGILIQDAYVRIFPMYAGIMFLAMLLLFTLPRVHGHRHGENRAPVRVIFQDPALLCLLFFNLGYMLGTSMFYNYYPLYFTGIGGNSSLVGIMLFVCAIAEVPFFFFAGRLIKRFGVYAMILTAGVATSLRWFLLYVLTDPVLIIAANALHGVGYVMVMYSMATHINTHAPKELRATAQSLIALISALFSRVLFGYVGGVASDRFGVENMMLFSSLVVLAASLMFAVWFKLVEKKAATTQSRREEASK